jgi:ribosomal protein L11 methyltransferase
VLAARDAPFVAWLALRFDADAGAADAWSDALLAAGALAVDIADPAAGTAAETPLYGEPGVAADVRWPIARVTALFPADADAVQARGSRRRARWGPLRTDARVAEQDWVRRRKRSSRRCIHDRLWIVPWCAPPRRRRVTLDRDAFGTGSHRRIVFASGPARARLHPARRCSTTDAAPAFSRSRRRSSARAASSGWIHRRPSTPRGRMRPTASPRLHGSDDLGADRFDVVVANILANPLRVLAPALSARVRAGGRIVLSGVLAEQAADVAAVYAPWFIIGVWKPGEDGWVALAGVRSGPSSG